MSIFKRMSGGYEELWKAIIRPPRDQYQIEDLGPQQFCINQYLYERIDFELKNQRNLILQCSHFQPVQAQRVAEQLPCVIYLHGNSSSRIESLVAVQVLLPQNITVFALDLSGSGMSQGEYISLGWYERDDLALVVDYLRNSGTVSTIGLWGRSMGACTSLLHGDRDPSIAGMVLDSCFTSLKTLARELAQKYASGVPKFVLSAATSLVKKTIRKKAGFNIDDLNPMGHVAETFIPALFVAAHGDDFILPHHTQELHEAYPGDKNLIMVDGDHNSPRPRYLLDSISIFFYNTLQCNMLPERQIRSGGAPELDLYGHQFENAMMFQQGEPDMMYDEEEMIRKAIEESLKQQ